ncbi:MAG TPA: hypothetical protein GX528_08190 [Firmicutes bacterium]|nr:hypothetical protein [Bacillota bacterium]
MPGKKVIALLSAALFLTGCWTGAVKIGFTGSAWGNKTNASFAYLSGSWSKTIRVKAAAVLVFDYELKSESGELKAKLVDPSGAVLLEFEANTSGREEVFFKEGGAFKFVIEAKKAKGSYRFEWFNKEVEKSTAQAPDQTAAWVARAENFFPS